MNKRPNTAENNEFNIHILWSVGEILAFIIIQYKL